MINSKPTHEILVKLAFSLNKKEDCSIRDVVIKIYDENINYYIINRNKHRNKKQVIFLLVTNK
jgi:hypothetical protein